MPDRWWWYSLETSEEFQSLWFNIRISTNMVGWDESENRKKQIINISCSTSVFGMQIIRKWKTLKWTFYMHGQTTKSAYCKLFCLLQCKKDIAYPWIYYNWLISYTKFSLFHFQFTDNYDNVINVWRTQYYIAKQCKNQEVDQMCLCIFFRCLFPNKYNNYRYTL